MEGHSHVQFLLMHHEAVKTNKLCQSIGELVHSLGGSSNNLPSLNQILPLNVVKDKGVLESSPSDATVNPYSIFSDDTTEKKTPATASKPIATTDWSLF
jgi:hypothetical protein